MIAAGLLDEYIERYSNWGRWGADDQAGTTNFITNTAVAIAARGVQHGHVVPLALTLGRGGPQTGANGRFNCMCYAIASGTDHEFRKQQFGGKPLPFDMGYADDTIVMHLQSATHWDSLCHIFHQDHMYNGYPASESTAGGSARNGLEHLTGRLVGRGVLLDIPASKGVDSLDDGYPITVDDLEAAAEFGGVTVQEGDILLLRTGQLARCRAEGWGTFAGGDAPGLSFLTVPWVHERRIAAVASDTWGVEVRPNEIEGAFQPFHIPALVYMGLAIGEMFDLEELSVTCAECKRYEMLVCASPLPFIGTAGGPPGPVAII